MATSPLVRKFRLRPYQIQMVEIARQRNTIVCLPTGAGKTVISMELMVQDEIREQVRCGKKIVFVVTTVQLADQQGKAIRDYTAYNVLICSSNTTNGWSVSRWTSELEANQVIVIIAQIFYEKLLANFVKFDLLALLVLDECHNATKAHPMNQIMTMFKDYSDQAPPKASRPRILGLTATLNKAKIKDLTEAGIKRELEKLERTMQSKALGAEDQEEVERFSTYSLVEKVIYPEIPKSTWNDLIDGITKLSVALGSQQSIGSHRTDVDLKMPVSQLPNFDWEKVYANNKNDIRRDLANFLADFLETYLALGPLACYNMVESKKTWLKSLKADDMKKFDELNLRAVKTQLDLFEFRFLKLLNEYEKKHGVDAAPFDFISHKVEMLMGRLETLRQEQAMDSKEGSLPDRMLGLIFVKRRSFAAALKQLFQIFSMKCPSRFGFLHPDLVTGTNNIRRDGDVARVTPSKQKHVMQRFRNKEINLLICTSVLEEGIDVPQCNVVVRFDEIQGYTSFIQSMGRARMRNAKFLILMPTSAGGGGQLKKFMKQHKIMNELLPRQVSDSEGDDTTGVFQNSDEDDIEEHPDFEPLGPFGPKIKASSAISLVNRYVQRDEKRNILSWWAVGSPDPKTKKPRYYGYVYISDSTDAPSVIIGPISSSKDSAKRGVFLETCKKLFNAGALESEHLLPK